MCTDVQVYPAECGQQLAKDPSKNGSSKSLVSKIFLVSLTLWDTPVLSTPPLPLSQFVFFPGNEAQVNFSGGPRWGVLGGVQKVYVEKVSVLLLPVREDDCGGGFLICLKHLFKTQKQNVKNKIVQMFSHFS